MMCCSIRFHTSCCRAPEFSSQRKTESPENPQAPPGHGGSTDTLASESWCQLSLNKKSPGTSPSYPKFKKSVECSEFCKCCLHLSDQVKADNPQVHRKATTLLLGFETFLLLWPEDWRACQVLHPQWKRLTALHSSNAKRHGDVE